ncbi:MAG: hypothetical protein WC184_10885 [Acidimicrobiia bacterium]
MNKLQLADLITDGVSMGEITDPTMGVEFRFPVLRGADQLPVKTNPATWQKYETMRDFGDLPKLISRDDLRQERASAGSLGDDEVLRRLFVMTMMWGSGTRNGRGPRNCDKALASKPLPVLRESAALVADGDLSAAYMLHKKLPGVGPAFFTKWLWLVGSNQDQQPQPLILDSLVWKSLAELGWDSREASGSRLWAKRYVAYLNACRVWAKDNNTTPEDIEYTLFARASKN